MENAIKVYLLSIYQAELISEEYCRSFFPERLKRAEKYRRREDYLRSIGAGALLHSIVGAREEEISFGEYGKPKTDGRYKPFCLSHSGNYTALAIDDAEIGVDIEVIDPSHLSVAKRVYTTEELEWMNEDPVNRFFALWTMKEAVLKQCGKGLSLSPESFSVTPFISNRSIMIDGAEMYGKYLFYDSHCISVCTEHKIDRIKIKELTYSELK